jgi:demethylmenaquinone methyltransferase/2-methoxy-6-polyprenyl-1,4-benzoquinol methylase
MRRVYYDGFSKFYDRFVALHSRDSQGLARKFLADLLPAQNGNSILDVCTGTAALLSHLRSKVGCEGRIVGVDFSHGMLKVAHEKTRNFRNIHLVEADAGHLPFPADAFDVITCSHAFYELKGETQNRALREIVRVLGPKGVFLMMEHDVPSNVFVRALFYLRLTFIGARRAMTFLRHEREVLESHFAGVEKVVAPPGHSKVLLCRK